MRKVFVALALVAIIVSATMLPEVREKAKISLQKLHKSRIGKNIVTAIQLELSSKNRENIIVNILALLNELLNDQSTQLVQAEADLASKQDYCNSSIESYQNQISSKQADISNAQGSLPALHAELETNQANLADQEAKLQRASENLSEANDINDAATEAFNKSIANHNDMLDALREARALIVQLQSSSFLQKNNSVLIQLSNHKALALKKLERHSKKSLFSLLMQMAQDIGIQADQTLVGNVLTVIDDLLQHEQDGIDSETIAEHQRIDEYNALVADLNGQITDASNQILSLTQDIQTLGNTISDTENNISTWTQQVEDLQHLLEDLQNQCSADIAHYEDLIEELTGIIEVIKQVIAIFEGQSIQDVKPLFDEVNEDDGLGSAESS